MDLSNFQCINLHLLLQFSFTTRAPCTRCNATPAQYDLLPNLSALDRPGCSPALFWGSLLRQASGGEWRAELLFTVPKDHPEIQRLEGKYKKWVSNTSCFLVPSSRLHIEFK